MAEIEELKKRLELYEQNGTAKLYYALNRKANEMADLLNKTNLSNLNLDDAKDKTLMEWSRISGNNPRLIRYRINHLKWQDIKMAVFKPTIRRVNPVS